MAQQEHYKTLIDRFASLKIEALHNLHTSSAVLVDKCRDAVADYFKATRTNFPSFRGNVIRKSEEMDTEPAPAQFRLPRHSDPQQPRHDRGMTFEAHCDRVMQYWNSSRTGNQALAMANHSAALILKDQQLDPCNTHCIAIDWRVESFAPIGLFRFEFEGAIDTIAYLIDPEMFVAKLNSIRDNFGPSIDSSAIKIK